jgi:hypothetical protein
MSRLVQPQFAPNAPNPVGASIRQNVTAGLTQISRLVYPALTRLV